MSSEKKFFTITLLQWCLFFVLLVYLYWAMPKGFDTFDEGIALLHANPDQLQIYQPIRPGPLLNIFVQYDNSTVLTYRWLRFWFLLICTAFLALSVYVWARQSDSHAWTKSPYVTSLIPCVLISGLISYVNAPFSIHYNHIVYCLMALIVGVVFMDAGKRRIHALFWVLCGILTVLLAYIKWPSAIAIVFASLSYRILLTRVNIVPVLVLFLVGCIAGVVVQNYLQVLFLADASQQTRILLNYTKEIASGGIADSVSSLKDISATDSYIFSVLKNYLLDARKIIDYLFTGRSLAIISIVAAISFFSTRVKNLRNDQLGIILTLVTVSILIYLLVVESTRHPYSLIYASIFVSLLVGLIIQLASSDKSDETYVNVNYSLILPIVTVILSVIGIVTLEINQLIYNKFVFISIILLFGIVVLIIWKPISIALNRIPYTDLLAVSFLFIVPFCIAFGHDGGFVVHLMYGLPFWVLSMLLLSSYYFTPVIDSDGVLNQKIIMSTTSLILSFVIVLQVTYNSMFNPYHTYTSLHEQKYPVETLPKLAGIELDPLNQKFFNDLGKYSDISVNNERSRPTLVVGSMPGMAYANSSYSPGHLWYTHNMKFGFGNHNAKGNMCENFIQAVNVYGLPDIIIPVALSDSNDVRNCLEKIDFPESFMISGSMTWYDYRKNAETKLNYYKPTR